MKKTYSKPDIYFESFALSTDIAATCNMENTNVNFAYGTCAMVFGTRSVFTNGINACNFKVAAQMGEYNGVCYHIPANSKATFQS